ncbi:putative glucan endo-1,3-beta-D-glucosidase [Lupinus albus]|uniref:glucan endo-1,3-beta-D-glucosidase n=1 Tax=Lupinus albus TaxID=3870 RepID=A0A6A4R8L8_LUPAL|nr:putative glucan endo-1,3-beta-D-glucosidase [Lupinus albus]
MSMLLLIHLLLLSMLFTFSSAKLSPEPGICYGQLGNDLPPPQKSLELIKTLKAKRVKIYDTSPQILQALRNTNIEVSIMVPNQLISNIAKDQTFSNQWIQNNVVPFYPKTLIRYILVGNEVISTTNNQTWSNLLPAMRNIEHSLGIIGIHNIKIGTPHAMDVLKTSFPPSKGEFRNDISDQVLKPMLEFLSKSESFFFLDVYPFFAWSSDPKNINLDYALFKSKYIRFTDPGTGLVYNNLFDQMIDAVYFAINRLGYPNVPIFIAETGWPNSGDSNQIGANINNAATYNRNFIKKVTKKPTIGTPLRPGVVLQSFLFSLFNENQKPGPGTERHFGLFYPNGKMIYDIDLSGKKSKHKKSRVPKNNSRRKRWCVVARGVNVTSVAKALSYACSQGNGTCDLIQPGKKCYRPNSVLWDASYAFSSYWAQFKKIGGTCYFNGLATQTSKDPSKCFCFLLCFEICHFFSQLLV